LKTYYLSRDYCSNLKEFIALLPFPKRERL
jgi:hypothetical protein